MATVIITLKVMPSNPDVDLNSLSELSIKAIRTFADIKKEDTGSLKVEQRPVAFGLNEIIIMFAMDEKRGGTEKLEQEISNLEGVNSVEVTDVRRAIG